MSFIPLPHALATVFAVVVIAHGLVHLLGAAKGLRLANVAQLERPISAPVGMLWLLAALGLVLSAVLVLTGSAHWWTAALPSVLLSQTLILMSWKDARFGTVANVIVIVPTVLSLWLAVWR